jgi:hypothetical protein
MRESITTWFGNWTRAFEVPAIAAGPTAEKTSIQIIDSCDSFARSPQPRSNEGSSARRLPRSIRFDTPEQPQLENISQVPTNDDALFRKSICPADTEDLEPELLTFSSSGLASTCSTNGARECMGPVEDLCIELFDWFQKNENAKERKP